MTKPGQQHNGKRPNPKALGTSCQDAQSKEEQNHAQQKTTICEKWLWGTCQLNAADCPFAHGIKALATSKTPKTSYCRAFFSKAGYCRAGDKCRFAHDSAELNCGQPKRNIAQTIPADGKKSYGHALEAPRDHQGGISWNATSGSCSETFASYDGQGLNQVASSNSQNNRCSSGPTGFQVTASNHLHLTGRRHSAPDTTTYGNIAMPAEALFWAVSNAYHASFVQGLGFDDFNRKMCDELHISPIDLPRYMEGIKTCLAALQSQMAGPQHNATRENRRVGRRHSEPAASEVPLSKFNEAPGKLATHSDHGLKPPKSTICKKWLWGACELTAASCPFAHGVWTLEQTSNFKEASYCKAFFSKGGHCRAGDRCRFAHGSDELRNNAGPDEANANRRHSDPAVLDCNSSLHWQSEGVQSDIASNQNGMTGRRHSSPAVLNLASFHIGADLQVAVSNALRSSIQEGGTLGSFTANLGEALQMGAEELHDNRHAISECLNKIEIAENACARGAPCMEDVGKAMKSIANENTGAWGSGVKKTKERVSCPMRLTYSQPSNVASVHGPEAQSEKVEIHRNAKALKIASHKVAQSSSKLLEVLPCLLETDEEHAELSECVAA